jgi:hypothetical protein
MTDELITYETAKLAKTCGFDEVTEYIYMTDYYSGKLSENLNGLKNSDGDNPFVSAPSQSTLQKWLRENKELFISINWWSNGTWNYTIGGKYELTYERIILQEGAFYTYEGALEQALVKALNLIGVKNFKTKPSIEILE